MPKMKSHSGAKKRFRVTARGKLLRQQAGRNHLLEKKPSKLTRRIEGRTEVAANDKRRVRRLLNR